ncbi:hypothetical protein ACVWYG_000072 [Pedobacter sp. UYEF25]
MHCNTEKVAFDCNHWLKEIIANDLPTVYERIFSKTNQPEIYLNLSSIRVDLGTLTAEELKKQFLILVEEKININLAKQINERPNQGCENPSDVKSQFNDLFGHLSTSNESPISYGTKKSQQIAALFYLVEFGRYPWWYRNPSKDIFSKCFLALEEEERKDFVVQLLKKIKELSSFFASQAISRFTEGMSAQDLLGLINLIGQVKAEIQSNIDAIQERRNQLIEVFGTSEKSFSQKLFAFSFAANTDTDFFEHFLVSMQNTTHMSLDVLKKRMTKAGFKGDYSVLLTQANREESKSIQNKLAKSDKKIESLYIGNAGLVLLHPFLSTFFSALRLINRNMEFVSVRKQQRAAVLLYYLQCGSKNYQEWEMPFNKILVGLHPEAFLPNRIKPSRKERDESRNLLATVVNHWTALKGSSVEALQQTFFMREGKISQKDSAWFVQVERGAVDVLLDKLPWSIGTIKLPWLEEIIHVEW